MSARLAKAALSENNMAKLIPPFTDFNSNQSQNRVCARQPGPARPAMIVNSEVIGRACWHCGGETFLTLPGRGPHAMGLQCIACGQHGGWVSRAKAEALLKMTDPARAALAKPTQPP